jgi:hypothetical protein
VRSSRELWLTSMCRRTWIRSDFDVPPDVGKEPNPAAIGSLIAAAARFRTTVRPP